MEIVTFHWLIERVFPFFLEENSTEETLFCLGSDISHRKWKNRIFSFFLNEKEGNRAPFPGV
jgi:hypothetical protein